MRTRSVRSIGSPKSAAGHFDHFDVIGLETLVDRADAGHLRGCDGQLVGESAGASNCDEKYRYQASPKLKTKLSDPPHENSPWPTERSPFATAPRLPERLHHPVGIWGQVLGRGLLPRLSIGTLQLSIRCSSIHFLPSRSFPVSTAGPFEGAAFGAGRSPAGSLSRADAGSARQIVSNQTSNGPDKGPMDSPISPSPDAARPGKWPIQLYRDLSFHPEPGCGGRPNLPRRGKPGGAEPAGQVADKGC